LISWIRGELVDSWQYNNKCFILINCQGLGYEIQILDTTFVEITSNKIPEKDNVTLWIKHIKREESDLLFGFKSKSQKEFFIKILNIKGIGSQIGMALLNKFSINELTEAINNQDKKLISSIPGIGQKMTERIILELKSKKIAKTETKAEQKDNVLSSENSEIHKLLEDIEITLKSLNYSKNEIKKIFPALVKEIENEENQTKDKKNLSFENLLKYAMNCLDKKNSYLGS